MREIRLYGELARRYGRSFMMEVDSVAEAIRALSANFKGFEQELMTAHLRGVEYVVRCGDEDIPEENLRNHLSLNKPIRIAPVVVGRKKGGVLQTIIGAVLIVVGVIMTANGIPFGANLIQAGVALVAGGILQMLTPTPKAKDPNENPENTPNTYFDGAVNTTAQGHPVPLGYGRLLVGSAVISGGLSVEDVV